MVNNTVLRGSISIIAGLFFSLFTSAQESQLKLVFAGDIMGHDTQIASALATGEPGYDYKPCFEHLRPYLQEADLVIANLEVTFAGEPYKGYPAFSSPDELASALKWAGFDILVNANNHGLDRGQKGLVRTIEVLGQEGLVQTGTFADPDSRLSYYPLIVEKKGIRIALLNYTYGTNGIKTALPVLSTASTENRSGRICRKPNRPNPISSWSPYTGEMSTSLQRVQSNRNLQTFCLVWVPMPSLVPIPMWYNPYAVRDLATS